ncbi:MAG: hypothetical protein JWQ38_2632 [Flavipsychrobacter sp.]|nr:hypothetical protein [Flavipsychrobacter sp.]
MAKNNNNRADNAKTNTVQPEGSMHRSAGAYQNTGEWRGGRHTLIAGGIALLTWLVLKVALVNQFTDWDDAGYIVNNPIIRDLSAEGLKRIFTEPVMGNYHPITILSYALEYSMVELEPWLYHLDSLLLHILVTMSVYWFVVILTKKPVAAIITALLFGISPMHVESAVWAAGRKDLFCALFYVWACIAHLHYQHAATDKKSKWYILVILLFLFALLSKPIAVTLPVTLLLIDYYEQRKWTIKLLVEKIPHFALALFFGAISVTIQHGGGAMDVHKVHYNFIERIALGSYALVTYLWKSVVPVHLCCYYPYPPKVAGSLPYIYFLAPLLVAAIAFIVWRYARKNRTIVFGSLFFIVNIALLLQLIPVGDAIVADRYSYIPYIGLFFIAGLLLSRYLEQDGKKNVQNIVIAGVAIYMICLAWMSYERCKVWYDPISLWRDEIEKEPVNAPLAYNNLGFIYFHKKSAATNPIEQQIAADSAFYLMQKAIALKPDFGNALQGLGMLSYMKGDLASAGYYFRTAIHYEPTADNYANYGNILIQEGKTDSTLMQYNTAVSLNPEMFIVRLNRGRLLKEQNRLEEAKADIDKAIQLNPGVGEPYYLRSFYHAQKGDKALALQDVEKAISLGFQQVDNNYYQGLK